MRVQTSVVDGLEYIGGHSYTEHVYQQHIYDIDQVTQLANNVNEVSDLSKSMHVLVEQQGELVDNIEHNITVSHGRVVVGTQDLKKAEYYSRNNCILGLIAVLILVVIGLIIAVGVKFHDRN